MQKTWTRGGRRSACRRGTPARTQHALAPTLRDRAHQRRASRSSDGLRPPVLSRPAGRASSACTTAPALRRPPFLNIDPHRAGRRRGGPAQRRLPSATTRATASSTSTTPTTTATTWSRATRAPPADPFVANPASRRSSLPPAPRRRQPQRRPDNFGPDGYLYIAPATAAAAATRARTRRTWADARQAAPPRRQHGRPVRASPRQPVRRRRRARAARSGPTACATPGASPSTARRATCSSATSARARARRSTSSRPAWAGCNYGWDDMEGSLCFEPPSGCLTANRVLPIIEVQPQLGRLRDRGRLPLPRHAGPVPGRQVPAQRQLHGPHPRRDRDVARRLERLRRPRHAAQHLHASARTRTASSTSSAGRHRLPHRRRAVPAACRSRTARVAEGAGARDRSRSRSLDRHRADRHRPVRDRAPAPPPPAPTSRRPPAP